MRSKEYWRYFGFLIRKSCHGSFRVLESAEVLTAIGIGIIGYFRPEWKHTLEVLFLVLVGLFFLTLLCGIILAAHVLDNEKKTELSALKQTLELPQTTDQFQQSVLVFRAELLMNLDGRNDPVINFTYWLFNGSLLTVYLKSVKGHAKFMHEEFSYSIELLDDQHDIPRGGRYRFKLRQSVTREAAKQIVAITNAKNGALPQFSFDSVFLSIASHDSGFESLERRLDLPEICLTNAWQIRWPS